MSKVIEIVIPVFILILISTLFASCSLSLKNNTEKRLEKTTEIGEMKKIDETLNSSEKTENNLKFSQTAKYKIEFIAQWSLKTHPNHYPKNAHFSPFVAYSHNNSDQAKIFTENGLATAGVEDMAETGATGILVKEINKIIEAKNAHQQTRGKRIDSPDTDSSELEFSQKYSHVTFVSMLAPSPDWFVAGLINMFENGEWKNQVEIDLVTYDAGTDDGKKLTSPDKDSKPKQKIEVFDDRLQNLGKVVLTRVK